MRTDLLPAPPLAPDQYTCCGRGCCPCIFDYYDAAFAEWEDRIRGLGFAPDDVLESLGEKRATRPY